MSKSEESPIDKRTRPQFIVWLLEKLAFDTGPFADAESKRLATIALSAIAPDAVSAASTPTRRCTCYVMPHADDCEIFVGITQAGERVIERRSGSDRRAAASSASTSARTYRAECCGMANKDQYGAMCEDCPENAPVSHASTSDPRALRALRWAVHTFGSVAIDRKERACRFIEEATELVNSLDLPVEITRAIVERVYSRPGGVLDREAGQAMMTLELLAEVIGVSLDEQATAEFERVQAIPQEEWNRRHLAKVALGIANVGSTCASATSTSEGHQK